MTTIIIDVDKRLDELMAGEADKEEYEKSVKNGMVLTIPDVHPPDVDVEVATGKVLTFTRETDGKQNNKYVFKKQDGTELRLSPNTTVSELQNRL